MHAIAAQRANGKKKFQRTRTSSKAKRKPYWLRCTHHHRGLRQQQNGADSTTTTSVASAALGRDPSAFILQYKSKVTNAPSTRAATPPPSPAASSTAAPPTPVPRTAPRSHREMCRCWQVSHEPQPHTHIHTHTGRKAHVKIQSSKANKSTRFVTNRREPLGK